MFVWHETSWMWTSMIAFWLLFAMFVFYAIKSVMHPKAKQSSLGATAVLDQRLARGEISAEEYRERRAALDAPPDGRTDG